MWNLATIRIWFSVDPLFVLEITPTYNILACFKFLNLSKVWSHIVVPVVKASPKIFHTLAHIGSLETRVLYLVIRVRNGDILVRLLFPFYRAAN